MSTTAYHGHGRGQTGTHGTSASRAAASRRHRSRRTANTQAAAFRGLCVSPLFVTGVAAGAAGRRASRTPHDRLLVHPFFPCLSRPCPSVPVVIRSWTETA
jgi:hypothetical protein